MDNYNVDTNELLQIIGYKQVQIEKMKTEIAELRKQLKNLESKSENK